MNIQNEQSYDIVKERHSQDVIVVTYKKKEIGCDICKSLKKSKDISTIKYPILNRHMGRLIMTKSVCEDCLDDVMEILNNLKDKYQGRRELS